MLRKLVRIDFFTSVLVVFLFLALPQTLSNVYWISGRTDLLALSFSLIAIIFAMNYFSNKNSLYLVAVVIFLILGLATKETAIATVMYIVLIYLFFYLKRKPNRSIYRDAPVFLSIFGITAIYFILRYLLFGAFTSTNSSLLARNIESPLSWLASGLFAVYLPADFVDLTSLLNENDTIMYGALGLALFSLALVIANFVRMYQSQRIIVIKLLMISSLAVIVYLHSTPQIRLAYFMLPFSVGAVVLFFTFNKSSIVIKILSPLYFLLMLASSTGQVYKHFTISKMQRQIEAVLDQNRMDTDTLYLVGQLGRVGQTWVSSSDAFLLPPSEVVKGSTRKTRELFYLPAFEGHVLTDLKNPYLIEFNADTLILTSNSLTSGFVPLPAYKYPQHGLYVQKGLKHKPVVFIPKRRGIAHKIKIYPLPHTDAPTVYYYNDSFRIEPFSEFRARFTSKGKPTNTE